MNINYDIPDDLHRAAKMAAASQRTSLKLFLWAALDFLVDDVNHGRIALICGDDPDDEDVCIPTWTRIEESDARRTAG